jgi:hypothetical protein
VQDTVELPQHWLAGSRDAAVDVYSITIAMLSQ